MLMSTKSSFSPHSRLYRQGITHFPSLQDYSAVLELQREFFHERIQDRRPDTLILVEHPKVFTFGRRSKPEHLGGDPKSLQRMGFDVYEVERGGSVTYHGPGQIVGYPILRLRDFCPGPKIYVRMLEEVVIRVLAEWGITGDRVEKWRGVWINQPETSPQKIAAIGVRVSRGVTFHGFSLNVNVDLKPFELITPCGIEGCQVTSMERILGRPVDGEEVRRQIIRHFGEVFGLEWET